MSRVLPLIVLGIVAGACSFARPSMDAAGGSEIRIADLAHGAYAGSTVRLAAAVGEEGPGRGSAARVRWTSRYTGNAWVAEDGTMALLSPGRVTVTARLGRAAVTRSIEIRDNPARAVDLRGEPRAEVRVGVPIRLTALVTGPAGPIRDARVNFAVVGGAAGRPPGTATVTRDGIFTATEPGVYTVVAEFGGRADQVTMLLGMPGITTAPASSNVESVEIESRGYDAYVGTTLPLSARVMLRGATTPERNPRIHWSSSDPDVAWLGQDGVAVLEGPGRVTISAEYGKIFATRTFDVLRNPARTVVLDGELRRLRTRDTLRLAATAFTADGAPVANPRIHFGVIGHTPGAEDAGHVVNGDRFVATRPGVYTVVAQLGGIADTQVIVVTR